MHYALINNVLAGRAAEAFCSMLLHSLWQGLLFTIITGAVMMITKKSSSRLRYNIMCVLFFLFLATCAITFIWQLNNNVLPAVNQQGVAGTATESTLHIWVKKFNGYFSANARLILMVWGIVFLAKCARMTASVVYSQRVRHYKTQQPPVYWQNKIAELSNQLQLKKKIKLLQSDIVKMPVVIGHLKPIVFIPLGLLNNLPAGEIEAVLLHELAHIRRNDYFVNIIQVMAENVFFFNPALLWMSAIIRDERENCCDDVAVAQTKSKKQFIQALISFKEHALHTSAYTTAFPAKKNQLLHRVTRIISNSNKTLSTGEKTFFLASFVILAGLLMAVTTGVVKPDASKAAAATSQQVKAPNTPAIKDQTLIDRKEVFEKDSRHSAAATSKISPVKARPAVYEEYHKIVTIDNIQQVVDGSIKVVEPMQVAKPIRAAKPILTDAQQAEIDRQQAEEDRKQALRDQAQAELDRQQALKDQEQARLDQIQAQRDKAQADEDRKQADLARKQADKDREQADIDRKKADKEKVEPNNEKTQPIN